MRSQSTSPYPNLRPPSPSLYETLRVNHTATPSEIKAAYRSLAKVYHPDALISSTAAALSDDDDEEGEGGICGGGREFMEIHHAYATLSDPAARAVYDLKLGFGCRRRHGHGLGVLGRVGSRPTRRWETDQCW
ncbi:hypothetical protein MLD38_001915 [Melastoma candidum]|uniref:Uncharacterized protein n=1 Tax=Melastoma candidum TaxID=119954 RepID=A0ACB9SJP0_9MYRT|nr:hypothetical protein MLD38_001915 [Melastoma candidum]